MLSAYALRIRSSRDVPSPHASAARADRCGRPRRRRRRPPWSCLVKRTSNVVAVAVVAAVALTDLSTVAAAQLADLQPGRNFTAQPNFGFGNSVDIDPGDADLDGDLDVVVANGGDGNPQLSRIFINDGFGAFADETATRFALVPSMRSNDVDFVDFENDGDLDLFFANHDPGISSSGQVSRFIVNLG